MSCEQNLRSAESQIRTLQAQERQRLLDQRVFRERMMLNMVPREELVPLVHANPSLRPIVDRLPTRAQLERMQRNPDSWVLMPSEALDMLEKRTFLSRYLTAGNVSAAIATVGALTGAAAYYADADDVIPFS